MSSKDKKFFVTTPIYYVNDQPHLGSAYTTLAADVLARYHRIKGEKVFFLTGTDEHGGKIAEAAEKEGLSPQQLADQNVAKYQMAWDTLNISYDNFIRTTNPAHIETIKTVIRELDKKRLIYPGKYQGLYCQGCERFYTPKELVNGKCPDHQREPQILEEDCYFFKLSAFQKPLLKLIDQGELIIEPKERRNEITGFLKTEKLNDLSISRQKVKWGIPLPIDERQTIYVWVDAFFNYLTGVGWRGDFKKLPEFWPADLHLIGKDILRVHATIWPALLLALEIPLPKKIYAHGFFTINGQKMSKSLGNVIDPGEMAKIFSVDGLRYLLLAAFPFGQDGDFSQTKFYEQYQADLANGLGNLVARITALAEKEKLFKPVELEKELIKTIETVRHDYQLCLDEIRFFDALSAVWSLIKFCDIYINENEPWRLFKGDLDKFDKVIYNLLESLRQIAWLIQPFMPETADQIWQQLGILEIEKKKSLFQAKEEKIKYSQIKKGESLFPKLQK